MFGMLYHFYHKTKDEVLAMSEAEADALMAQIPHILKFEAQLTSAFSMHKGLF